MRFQYTDIKYCELSVEERCNAICEARDYADEQESMPIHARDWMVPFDRDDPRFEAFINRSNEVRAARGQQPLQIVEWWEHRGNPAWSNGGNPVGIVAPESSKVLNQKIG